MRKICQRVTFRGDCLSLVTLPITRHDKFALLNYHVIIVYRIFVSPFLRHQADGTWRFVIDNPWGTD
jgi:hypothetical protein